MLWYCCYVIVKTFLGLCDNAISCGMVIFKLICIKMVMFSAKCIVHVLFCSLWCCWECSVRIKWYHDLLLISWNHKMLCLFRKFAPIHITAMITCSFLVLKSVYKILLICSSSWILLYWLSIRNLGLFTWVSIGFYNIESVNLVGDIRAGYTVRFLFHV